MTKSIIPIDLGKARFPEVGECNYWLFFCYCPGGRDNLNGEFLSTAGNTIYHIYKYTVDDADFGHALVASDKQLSFASDIELQFNDEFEEEKMSFVFDDVDCFNIISDNLDELKSHLQLLFTALPYKPIIR